MELKCPKCGETGPDSVMIESEDVVCICGHRYLYQTNNDRNLLNVIDGTDRIIILVKIIGWVTAISTLFVGVNVHDGGFGWMKFLAAASIVVTTYVIAAFIFICQEHIRYQSMIVDKLKEISKGEK